MSSVNLINHPVISPNQASMSHKAFLNFFPLFRPGYTQILLVISIFFCTGLNITTSAQNSFSDLPRLSPRPWSVSGVKDCLLSLNGTWRFRTSSIRESDIETPGEWSMQGFDVPEGETAVYTRSFTIPVDWQGHRIKLRFDGVSSCGLVKVNNQTVGEHEGGMVPFELDITEAIRPGINELCVETRANTVSDRLGCVSQYAVHTVGGLVRKVSLYVLPAVNIAFTDAVTTLDKSYKNATLNISTQIANEVNVSGAITVAYVLTDAAGKKIASIEAPAKQKQANAVLKIDNARLWNPEQPYLYTLTTTLSLNGKPLQENRQRVGLRQVEVKGNRLLVNGRKVKLHGVNRHETHPLRGRSLTPELCRKDVELFRNGNCNYIRTSHYPPSEEFLDACDELGMFVECEAAITWIQHHASPVWKIWNYEDEQYLPYMLRANLDNIAGNRHHPSIIIWSLGNESRWSGLWTQVLAIVKKTDPSRPTCFHDQCWGEFNNAGSKADIANYHYPGIDGPSACDTMKRPTLFGEYAHLSCYNRLELATDPGIRATFGKPLMQMYDSIYYHDACLGGALWSGIDDIFHLADGRILGYGPWGPLDGWRRTKPEYTAMKKAYMPVRILKEEYSEKEKGLVVEVENRYDFTHLKDVKIEFGSESSMRTVKADIAPRSKGKLVLPGVSGYLKITDPRGFVCVEEMLNSSPSTAEITPHPTVPVQTDETDDVLRIRYSGNTTTEYTISKTTGLITQATINGKTVLRQGPVFCIVPMNSDDGGKPNVAGETYHNNIYPLKNYPFYTLFAKAFQYQRTASDDVMLHIAASYHGGAEGHIAYIFNTEGKVIVTYEITLTADVNPRQYGLLFQVDKNMETLAWERIGEFSHYPDNDIARISGETRLNVRPLYEVEAWCEIPAGDWKDDANYSGSVDFRSTKAQIRNASLTDVSGNSIRIDSDGTQALRAWLQDGCIQLLVADYNNNGAEPFYTSPFTANRTKAKKNDVLRGKVVFEIVKKE